MSTAALVVSRFKSPAGISESERHALQCGLWLQTSPEKWTGFTWIDSPHSWTHLQSLIKKYPISLLHLHALDKLQPPLERLEELLQQQQQQPQEQDSASRVGVEYVETLTKNPLTQVLKRHGISPMHILPQLDSRVLKQSALLALGLVADEDPVELVLGRMPRILHMDDATARETLHIWPPATQGQAVVVGGTTSTNSLFGLVASNSQYLATVLGKRCWAVWLQQPLFDLVELSRRQDAVAWLVSHGVARDSLHAALVALNVDTTQLAQQLAIHLQTNDTDLPAATGSTRKALQALYHLYMVATQKVPLIVESLQSALEGEPTIPALLPETLQTLLHLDAQLQNASSLAEAVLDLDQAPREFLVRASYKPELDDLQHELANTQQQLDECLEDMTITWSSEHGGSQNVRLESTNDGFQFRLPDGNASKVLQGMAGVRIHRVLKNGVYFSTKQLSQLSTKHSDLLAEYEQYQKQVVAEAMPVAASYVAVLDPLSQCLAQLDVLVGLASLACHKNYCRPNLTDSGSGRGIILEQARHPCVELHMEYIPNDVRLDEASNFAIVTGPNMGGKSTYLRALGAIVTLAQVGSFVPCTSATINLVDAVLARVGAGDQQDRGISTFMAEMLDSAAILNRATSRSLILIDELGRGTSTFDGYGLARAISEYIIKIRCFTVFTTHFHELTALQDSHPSVVNCHVTAQKSSTGLVFLYHVRPGPCLESFGIQVAEMAQVPAVVIQDAKRKALELEKFEYRKRSCGSSSNSKPAQSFWDRFQQVDLRSILASHASDDDKRSAVLAAMGLSVDILNQKVTC